MISIDDALKEATQRLYAVSDRPRLEAEILLCYHLGLDRIALVTKAQNCFNMSQYFAYIDKRAQNYPLEYITQEVSFYDGFLYIQKGVLIPRPETELLVTEVVQLIKKHAITKVAEIGVGSGAISTNIAKQCKGTKVVATDIDATAIETAQININRYGVGDRVKLLQTSLLDKVVDDYELIVSNPPYIAQNYILPKNVEYEPSTALFGGKMGQEILEQIVNHFVQSSADFIACEMGYDQKESMQKIFRDLGVVNYRFYKDLAGLDRGFIASKERDV